MHGSFERKPQHEASAYRSFGLKLVALPVLIAVALIGMAFSHPSASRWISNAVEAEFVGSEFVGTDIVPDLSPPTQFARPLNQIRTVKLN